MSIDISRIWKLRKVGKDADLRLFLTKVFIRGEEAELLVRAEHLFHSWKRVKAGHFFCCGRLSVKRGFHQSPSRPRECTTQGWLCGVPAWAQHTGTWPNKDGGESGHRRRLLPVLVCEGVKEEEEERRTQFLGTNIANKHDWFSYESATNEEQRSNWLLSQG